MSAPRPHHDEIVASAQSLMDALDLGEMHAFVDRQMDALEAVTGILRQVTELDPAYAVNAEENAYIRGKQSLARQLLEAIVRVAEA